MTEEEATATVEFKHFPGADDYVEVGEETIASQSRWLTTFSQVYRHVPTSTFWEIVWNQGSTEMQATEPMVVSVHEVVPVEKTVLVYEKVKK